MRPRTVRSASRRYSACRCISCMCPRRTRSMRSTSAQRAARVRRVLPGHLVIDEAVYRDPDWTRAAAHVMARRSARPSIARRCGAGCRRAAACDGDRPLRVLRIAEGDGSRGFHEDPERLRRCRGPHVGAVASRRESRPYHTERVRADPRRRTPRRSSTCIRARAPCRWAPTPISSCGTRPRPRRSR